MEPLIKDIFFLFSIDQKKGSIRMRNQLNNFMLYAGLFDLTLKGLLMIKEKRWYTVQQETGDPVLDLLLKVLLPLEGQKTHWAINKLPIKTLRIVSLQIRKMQKAKLVETTEKRFLGIRFGYHFRISKPDKLKPILIGLDHTLFYGRKPSLETHLLILLLGVSGQLKYFFNTVDMKKRARDHFRKLEKSLLTEQGESFDVIYKRLNLAMRAQKAAT